MIEKAQLTELRTMSQSKVVVNSTNCTSKCVNSNSAIVNTAVGCLDLCALHCHSII